MNLITDFLLNLSIGLVAAVITNTLLRTKRYKIYKRKYQIIEQLSFVKVDHIIMEVTRSGRATKFDGIVYMIPTGDIMIGTSCLFAVDILTNPVNFYWRRKYGKYFKSRTFPTLEEFLKV